MNSVQYHSHLLTVDSLSLGQRLILLDICHHLKKLESGGQEQKLIIVTGESGSGKTQLFLHIRHLVHSYKVDKVNFDYCACAHTKASASWLGCSVLSEIFPSLPNKKTLSGSRFVHWLSSFRNTNAGRRLKRAKVFLFEDFTSIGQEKLSSIDFLLRAASLSTSTLPFGGTTVILFGSPFTGLRPVNDTQLFENYLYVDPERKFANPQSLYFKFDTVYFLTHSYRHEWKEDNNYRFRQFLSRLKRDLCTSVDADFVRSRLVHNLTLKEVHQFGNALHVFHLKAEAHRFNIYSLNTLFTNVFQIPQGEQILQFAVGSKVFLTRNINVEEGLYCYARGIVKAVVWENGFHLTRDVENVFNRGTILSCIAVYFPSYTGDDDTIEIEGKKCYKVKRQFVQYSPNNLSLVSSYKFPIMAGYATHRHRLENLEFEKLVLHMGISQVHDGSDYLCFTRVDSMSDILIVDDWVSNTRLRVYKQQEEIDVNANEEMRLSQMSKFKKEGKNIVQFLSNRQIGK